MPQGPVTKFDQVAQVARDWLALCRRIRPTLLEGRIQVAFANEYRIFLECLNFQFRVSLLVVLASPEGLDGAKKPSSVVRNTKAIQGSIFVGFHLLEYSYSLIIGKGLFTWWYLVFGICLSEPPEKGLHPESSMLVSVRLMFC